MTKREQIGKAYKGKVKPTKTDLISIEEVKARSIYELRLDEIDPAVVEKELRELVLVVEATNAKLEKSKAITHETLKLVVSL